MTIVVDLFGSTAKMKRSDWLRDAYFRARARERINFSRNSSVLALLYLGSIYSLAPCLSHLPVSKSHSFHEFGARYFGFTDFVRSWGLDLTSTYKKTADEASSSSKNMSTHILQ